MSGCGRNSPTSRLNSRFASASFVGANRGIEMVLQGLCVAAMCAVALEASAVAQGSPLATAAIAVPNLAADARPLGDERKFFIFHRTDTSLDEARADLNFCFRYVQTGPGIIFPYFYAWKGHGAGRPAIYDGGQYGMVGALIGAMIAGGLERSKRQMNMMHCMLPRGYQRYRISEPLWKELNGKERVASIEVQARLASGPVPVTPRIVP